MKKKIIKYKLSDKIRDRVVNVIITEEDAPCGWLADKIIKAIKDIENKHEAIPIKEETEILGSYIKKIVDSHSGFGISCSPSGYNASVERIPSKRCGECGEIKEYERSAVGLGRTPIRAIESLLKELKVIKKI